MKDSNSKINNPKNMILLYGVIGLSSDVYLWYKGKSSFPLNTLASTSSSVFGLLWEYFDVAILRNGLSDERNDSFTAGVHGFVFGYSVTSCLQDYEYKTGNAIVNGAIMVGAMLASYYGIKYVEERSCGR